MTASQSPSTSHQGKEITSSLTKTSKPKGPICRQALFTAAMRRCASPFGMIPPEESECNDVGEGHGIEAREAELQPAVDSLASSMSYHPLVEDPEWKLFASFDSLDFSFVGGAIGVCRPVPQEFSPIYKATLTMLKPTILRLTGLGSLFLGKKEREVMLWDTPISPTAASVSRPSSSRPPADNLRLADQMLRLALVGKPRRYSYWYLQYFTTTDVGKLLGRWHGDYREESMEGWRQGESVENNVILAKIEEMTGTRILVAPHDGMGVRRCFLLMGEEELVTRALTLLQGAVAQKICPSRKEGAEILAKMGGREGGLGRDERLEEIRLELRDKHKLRMMEMQRDGNCLFRALSAFEHGTESQHKQVRAMIVARLEKAPEAMAVTALVEGVSEEEYVKGMAQDRQWGGYTECIAYSEARGRSVRLFVENEKIGLRCTDIDAGQGPQQDDGSRVQLLLYKSHYWLLVRG